MTRFANNQRGLTRFVVCLFVFFVFAKCDKEWLCQKFDEFLDFEVEGHEQEQQQQSMDQHYEILNPQETEEEDEQQRMFRMISEYCLPKLVCELHARLPGSYQYSDSEKSLMSLIGSSFLGSVTPSKYHYAAHFGTLIQGFEGQGCSHLYPMCPFSGEDVQQIARKIPLR